MSRQLRYDAVLFDLDNTLYDYHAYWQQRLHRALVPVLARYPHLVATTIVERAITEQIYASHWVAFLRGLGVDDNALLEVTLADYQVNDYAGLVLNAGAKAMFAALRPQHKLGLITNGPTRTQHPKIAQFALSDVMDVIVVSEEFGVAKPDPAIFHYALDLLGVQAQRAVYVGDSLDHDLRGAAAANIDFVWMNPHGATLPPATPAPRAQIKQLADIVQLVQY